MLDNGNVSNNISSKETLSIKDIKKAINFLNKNTIPLKKKGKIVILPWFFKKYPKEVKKFIASYKIIGIDISIVYDRLVKNYFPSIT